jgi:uncharacterized protein
MGAKFPSARVAVLSTIGLLLVVSCSNTSETSLSVNNNVAAHLQTTSQTQNSGTQVKSPLPPPTGFVNDYARAFDPQSKQRLETVLIELKDKSGIEFAVVTIETTGGQPLLDYSLAVAKGWGIGSKDPSKGGGLLLMLAVKDRQWRIQVSRSLEQDLPDEVCKELGDQSKELYRQGQYAKGLIKYVKAIIERLEKIRGFTLTRKL